MHRRSVNRSCVGGIRMSYDGYLIKYKRANSLNDARIHYVQMNVMLSEHSKSMGFPHDFLLTVQDIAYRRTMGFGKPLYGSFWLSSLILPSLTERCSKSCVTCISFQCSWLYCRCVCGRAVMPCSRRTSSFMVDWLGFPFSRMKPLLFEL
jgi:hypothetical protein